MLPSTYQKYASKVNNELQELKLRESGDVANKSLYILLAIFSLKYHERDKEAEEKAKRTVDIL
ncbi:MAG: hypothetical protein ACTS8P_01380 [Arsenophonus sp. NC-XBC3-MAG3]